MVKPDLINAIRDEMLQRNETIAVAESVTSGMLQTALSTARDARKFFQGGLTAYNVGQKCRHLQIDPIHADNCDCVSEKIAQNMALNVCPLFQSDWGIGVCGYAAPADSSGQQKYAWFAIAYNGQVITSNRIESNEADGPPTQEAYVHAIFNKLHGCLLQNPD